MDDLTSTELLRTHALEAPETLKPVVPKPVVPRKRRRFGALLLLLVVVAAGYWLYARPGKEPRVSRRNDTSFTMPVVAAPVVTGDIDITLDALGTVTPLATVTVQSQISGYLQNVNYTEGQMVKKGDPLVDIDDRPYQLALTNAQGALERDQAMLQSAELDLKRYQDLSKTNAIPRQQLDQQVALVAQDRGNVLSDQAQIDTQKLNIVYCHITAPVGGRIGLRLVDPGNYVTPNFTNPFGTAGIVVITQLEPISVIFPVPEDFLLQIATRMRAMGTLPVTAFDRSGATKLGEGELKTLDNQIDTTTGTLKMRAIFANEQENLFPNQFVNVKLLIDVLHNATVIPTSAIQRGAPGTFVYLVNADNTVSVRPIALGPQSGERASVKSGLSPGDRVVIDGADRLRNGSKIELRQSAADAAAVGGATVPAGPGETVGAPAGAAEPSPAAALPAPTLPANPGNPLPGPAAASGIAGPTNPAAPGAVRGYDPQATLPGRDNGRRSRRNQP
jgi:membrane fusion protein, multidrug efflux system